MSDDLNFPEPPDTTPRPLIEAPDADQYAGYLIMQGMADNTVRNYRCLYQRWLDWCVTNGSDPARAEPLDLRAWSRTLHGSRAILAQARAVIGHLCALLDLDDRHLAIPVPRPPKAPSRALTDANARRLVTHARTAGTAGTAVLVGLYTAARRGEIAGMEWRHVGMDTMTWWRPKTKDWHTVPMHPDLLAHLDARRESGERWLFPGRHGGHVSPAQVWKWVLDVAEQAGVGRVTPHQLRHTALTMANDETRDLRAVMDFAGHTKPDITARYTRVRGDRLTAVVASLDYGDVQDDDGGADDE